MGDILAYFQESGDTEVVHFDKNGSNSFTTGFTLNDAAVQKIFSEIEENKKGEIENIEGK